MPLDDERRHTVQAEENSGGKAGETRSNDEDVGLFSCHSTILFSCCHSDEPFSQKTTRRRNITMSRSPTKPITPRTKMTAKADA